ncbi:alpha/beta-hydrolase [Hypoxylon fragiforme]|uniref:alpha/beta-hydrolase n=1 Tax=Hypoxylon fragiforme TaxID=63214 RepID=UPI0020C64BD0|nr:alpha/beta-hydrolase [Hypoxylon fragiforme]KAI2605191.1 alpha/beta-hydrolase [Hypoxylon fragiforme]
MSTAPDQQTSTMPELPLPAGITSAYVDCNSSCGLIWHILTSGSPGQPLVLFCHGFPELAFSWRKILPRIAEAGPGYLCVAMDQRGYGRTRGCPAHEASADVDNYVFTNLVRDLVCLVRALGYTAAHSIVGHDFGAVSSAMAALMRPDVFRSTIQMSHPHHRPPEPRQHDDKSEQVDIQAELAELSPPRKHYKWYNSTPGAASEWENPAQGLEAFLRGYFHLKSADWAGNAPRPLSGWSAQALQEMPEYYIMRAGLSMPETVAANMAGEEEEAEGGERWLSRQDLQVYCDEWRRTGFQGALNWYRAQTASTPRARRDLFLFAGRAIQVPCLFLGGVKDWGVYQQPGALEGYEDPRTVERGCFRGVRLVEGAGHWVQQEQPEVVVEEILRFFETL